MILVSGATGKVGRSVVTNLLERGAPVRALVRDPQNTDLPSRAEIAVGHYDRFETVAPALVGARGLFLMAPVQALAAHTAKMVAAAKQADVRKIVLLSSLSVEMDHGNAYRAEHEAAEALVKGSGCDWTILRAGELASNTLSWAKSIRSSRTVRPFVRNDASARIDPFDIGAVAAEAFYGKGHSKRTYALTGSEATTPQQCTEILGELLGVELQFSQMSDEEANNAWVALFGDTPQARQLIATLREPNLPWLGVRDTTSTLLRRPARTYRQWAAANIGHFR
jgi:uncharacterized protein YbjT (DUF2867 family)